MSIFRTEALESNRLNWMGNHSVALANSLRIPAVVSVVTIGTIMVLIAFGSYSVNVEAPGLVSFRPGIYALTTPLEGIVTLAQKNEGENVSKGEILYTITSKIMFGSEEKHESTARLIREKIASLVARKADIATSTYRVKRDSAQEVRLKNIELAKYQQLLITSNKKMVLTKKRNALFTKHQTNGFISEAELHETYRQYLAAEEEHQPVQVSIAQVNFDIQALKITCDRQLDALKIKEAEYNQQLADAHQALTTITSEASADIIAPLQGKLGYTSVIIGDAVKKGDVIGVVLPDGAHPIITLTLPSSSVGEVHPGQSVKVRVASFPWRKYGKLNGVVKTLSPTAIPTQNGMLFSVAVEPENNARFRLQHGMEIKSNITTSNKRAYQWFFDSMAVK